MQTPLFMRKQHGGMFSIVDVPSHPGDVWFVDSGAAGAANSSGAGRNPDAPFATIDYAVGQTTASNGDTIYVLPGHAETLTGAAGIAADVAGISIVGLGVGNNRPVITITSTDNSGTITVGASNVRIANLVIVCNDDGLTNAVVVTGDNSNIDIEFQDTSSTVEAATAVRLDTANNAKLKLKYLGFTGGNAVVSAVRLDDCDNVDIYIDGYGIVSTAWVEMVDVASTNVTVRGRLYTQGITNFTRDVVDTVTGSTWDAVVFDSSAGAVISGGSASALATDDVTAIATAIGVIDEFHDVPAADNVLNAQINEVIGNKTDAAAAGNVTTTDTLVGYIKQIVSEISGTTGVATWPTAAAPANAVSIVEALRYMSELQLPRMSTATSASALTSGTLFTYTGSIEILHIIGRVTTGIQAQVTNTKLTITPDALAAYDICAVKDINAFAAGTLLSITGTAAGAMAGTTAVGSLAPGQANPVIATCVTSGVISSSFSAASTGAIVWEMVWRPISAGATVA